MVSIDWTFVDIWTGFDAVKSVGLNGIQSVLTIFMQFLPIILIISFVLFILYKILGFVKWWFGISFGKKSKNNFKTNIKN